MRWYEHDKNARATNLSLLMSSLRLEHFDGTFIDKIMKPLPGCEQLAEKALKLITTSMNNGGYTKAENERKCCGLLILNDVKKLKYILRYNSALKKWQKCFELKFRDYSYGLIYYESSLFFIGGRGRGVQRNNTVKRFNMETFTWLEMASMSQRRDDLCVVMLNEKIYAFGGHDGGDPFNTVEMFDICTNHWQVLPAMSAHRYGASAIVYEEKIYIFGGLGIDCQPLSTVECYDPKTSSWTTCSNMNGARGWPGITILNEFIFLIGGYNEGMLNTVERYDPKQNIWLEVAPLKVARFGICAITVGKRIWALGGHDVYTVEEYNFENNEWNEKTALPIYGLHSYVEVPSQLVNRMQTICVKEKVNCERF
ncbi:PREDICTED: kelch-like protein 1 isoform X1 [Rhagoletis zephyria]|uniref:kelch-like protein 1 isoform X1 n=2 Tax=Rhagoletis zephyria TaxID=28612 RepID=UPI0008112DFC|nr:PREDICTED: kelch-like protein 1 isoform X1 [Rhagoletis zephyria]